MLTAEESTDSISTPGPETQSGSAPAKEADPYVDRVVTHSKIGVWDWYEEVDPDRRQISILSRFKKSYTDLAASAPYVVRMFRDVLSIPGCKPRLAIFGLTELGLALVPAASIW